MFYTLIELSFSSKDSAMWLLNLKNTLPSMRKKSHDRTLRDEPKEQHLSTVPKSCANKNMISNG